MTNKLPEFPNAGQWPSGPAFVEPEPDYKLPQETKDKWLPALDSGNYPQCSGHLHDGLGYCCLGVLAVADGQTFVPEWDDDEFDDEGNEVAPDSYYLPGGLNDQDLLDSFYATTLGLSHGHQSLLSSLNDGVSSIAVNSNQPLFPVWKALAEEEGGKVAGELVGPYGDNGGVEIWKFSCAKHSFAEIAAVIRTYL